MRYQIGNTDYIHELASLKFKDSLLGILWWLKAILVLAFGLVFVKLLSDGLDLFLYFNKALLVLDQLKGLRIAH